MAPCDLLEICVVVVVAVAVVVLVVVVGPGQWVRPVDTPRFQGP